MLANYEESRGNLAGALELFQKVALGATHARQRAKAYSDMGSCYGQMGNPMKAKQCFEQSLELVPSQPTLMVMLGLIAQKNGDLPEAVRQYSHALALQHTDVQGLLLAQALRQEGRFDEANAVFKRAARFSPNIAEAQKTAESLLSGEVRRGP